MTPMTLPTSVHSLNHADRLLGQISAILVHEAGNVAGHWTDLRVRVQVARRARTVGELLTDQFDLIPDTRARIRRDRELRREYLRALARRTG